MIIQLLIAALLLLTACAHTPDADGPHHLHGGGGSTKKGDTSSATATTSILPQVYLIGTQKGGSSSLFELIVQHPLLLKGTHKEAHYFNHDETYEKGLDGLAEKFPARKKDGAAAAAVFVDGTPMLECTVCWARMRDTYGATGTAALKLIAVLREPVSRDYSGYAHGVREELFLGKSFLKTKTMREIRIKEQRFIYGGQYAAQLRHVVEVFRRDQVLVLSTAMLIANTTHVVERILRFLGLPPAMDSAVLGRPLPHNDHVEQLRVRGGSPALVDCIVQHVPALDCAERDYMAEFYTSRNADLYAWLLSTRATAHPMEPVFPPFDDPANTMACVDDARAAYDAVLRGDDASAAGGRRARDLSTEKKHLADRKVANDGCRETG